MSKEEFILKLQETLEIEQSLNEDTVLASLDEWDSMTAMILIGLVFEEFSVTLTSEDVEKLTTVGSVIEKIGLNKFV